MNQMKEKWDMLQTVMEEMKTMKKREYFLTLAVSILSGLVIGMLISPRKRITLGSHNGNNNGSNNIEGLNDDCDCDYDCDYDCECDDCCCGDEEE